MNNKEWLRSRQTIAEINNLSKKINRLEKTGGAITITLFDRRAELEQRLHTKNQRPVSRRDLNKILTTRMVSPTGPE